MTDGDFGTAIYHTECRAAEIALNRLQDGGWDDWYRLADIESDNWPWLLAEFPVVAERIGVTQTGYDDRMAEQERYRRAWATRSDSRSKPDRAETGTGSVHESDGGAANRPIKPLSLKPSGQ